MRLKISILTPSFNSSKYLERAIESVLIQNYENYEHIIVDGGSTDETLQIVSKYDHLRWISEKDQGQSDAMNKAFAMSTGDIIVYLNADDYFDLNVFDTVITFFEDHAACKFLVGQLIKVYKNEKIPNVPSTSFLKILNYWPCSFPLNPVSYFYKREIQERIGSFPVNNHYSMDYWFLLRVYKDYKVFYLPKNLGFFQCFDNKSDDALRAKISLREVRNALLKKSPVVLIKFAPNFLKNKLKKKIKRFFKGSESRTSNNI